VLQGKDLEALSDDPDELQSDLQALAGPSAGQMAARSISTASLAASFRPKPPSARSASTRILSAEYDKLGYGRIEILTKPGTDQFHGQLYFKRYFVRLQFQKSFCANAAGL